MIKSHYHITLQDVDKNQLIDAAKTVRAKATTIDLRRDESSQIDRMITKYQQGISLEMLLNDVRHLKDQGYKVSRYKLEQMLDSLDECDNFDINENSYIETHVKVVNEGIKHTIDHFAFSSNPKEMDHFFYNARAFSLKEVDKIRNGIYAIEDSGLTITSIHYEWTVFDSNKQHDQWWL